MEILLDTSFLIAYHNKTDQHHERAREINVESAGINDYIYTETLYIIHKRNGKRKAVEYGKFLRKALEISRVSRPVFQQAIKNFQEYDLSFTDAALAASAQKLDKRIASFDSDFDQIGEIEKVS